MRMLDFASDAARYAWYIHISKRKGKLSEKIFRSSTCRQCHLLTYIGHLCSKLLYSFVLRFRFVQIEINLSAHILVLITCNKGSDVHAFLRTCRYAPDHIM